MTEIVKAYTLVNGKVVGFRSTDNPTENEVVLQDDDALVVAFNSPTVEPITETVNTEAPAINVEPQAVNQEQPIVNEKHGGGIFSWLIGR